MSKSDEPGQRNPLTYMMEVGVDGILRQMMFCLPGKILAFDANTQLAQIQCGIQRVVNGEGVTIPVIENVPVQFAGDGEWYFWHQITPGETEGLIHFSQRALDTWIDQGGPVAPHETRMLSEKDAFFIPGVRARPNAIPNFKNDGAGVGNYAQDTYAHFKSSGDVEIVSSGNVDVTSGGDINGQSGGDTNIEASGDVNVTGATINLN